MIKCLKTFFSYDELAQFHNMDLVDTLIDV